MSRTDNRPAEVNGHSKWIERPFGDVVRLVSGGTPNRENTAFWNGTVDWYSAKDLKSFWLEGAQEKITPLGAASGTRKVPARTPLILVRGMMLLREIPIGISLKEATFNQDVKAMLSEEIDGEYLAQLMKDREGELLSLVDQAGHGTGRLSSDRLNELSLYYPANMDEQRAIAAALSVWDRGIRQTTDLLTAKRHLKQGLMQKLLSGKLKFGKEDPAFQQASVGQIVQKLATAVEVDPAAQYREIGIRSHGKGIFHKEPVLGAVLGEKRVYRVEPGCLTVNIVFAWEQAVAVTSESEKGFIASHRFPMFKPDTSRAEPKYLLHYFLSPKGHEALQLASPGGAGRNRTMSQSAFLKLSIPLPSIRFQQQFVSLVENLDSEISHLTQQLTALKTQKKGMMRKLLSGEVRVKVPS